MYGWFAHVFPDHERPASARIGALPPVTSVVYGARVGFLVCLGVTAAALVPVRAHAQQFHVDSLSPGDHLRVWSVQQRLDGYEAEFVAWEDQTLELRLTEVGMTGEVRLPRRQVARLLVRRRRGSHWMKGTLSGAVAGVATGLSLQAIVCSEPGDNCDGWDFVRASLPVGGMGAALGTMIGWSIPDRSWLEVSVEPSVRRSDAGVRFGAGVELRVRLSM